MQSGEVLERPCNVRGAAGGSEAQVLADRQLEEQRTIFEHVGEAVAGERVWFAAADRDAEQLDVAGEDRIDRRHAQQRRRLTGAVGTEESDDLARIDVQVEVAHDGDTAVSGRQPGDGEQSLVVHDGPSGMFSVPRYDSMTRWSLVISRGVPSAIMTPKSMTYT